MDIERAQWERMFSLARIAEDCLQRALDAYDGIDSTESSYVKRQIDMAHDKVLAINEFLQANYLKLLDASM